jgi:hypothetical protein
MTAVFTDFDSTMAERIVVDSANGTVDVTFRNSGSTYRFGLSQPEISDIVSVVTARSKGKLLHQLLDIRNGVRVAETSTTTPASNVAVPKVGKKPARTTASAKVAKPVAKPTAKVKPTTQVGKNTNRVARNVTI